MNEVVEQLDLSGNGEEYERESESCSQVRAGWEEPVMLGRRYFRSWYVSICLPWPSFFVAAVDVFLQ